MLLQTQAALQPNAHIAAQDAPGMHCKTAQGWLTTASECVIQGFMLVRGVLSPAEFCSSGSAASESRSFSEAAVSLRHVVKARADSFHVSTVSSMAKQHCCQPVRHSLQGQAQPYMPDALTQASSRRQHNG